MSEGFFNPRHGDWQQRLSITVSVMREMSSHTDPMKMNEVYTQRMVELLPIHRLLSLSRRGMPDGEVRITRSSMWQEPIDSWKEPQRLPVVRSGFLARLMSEGMPMFDNRFELDPDDPAHAFLGGQKSLLAIPHYDNGEAVNMVVVTREEENAFTPDRFPEIVWMSNLFGRATHAARLAEQLRETIRLADHENRVIGEMQKSLLPAALPEIPTLDLAVYYQAVDRAGGDYYDFLPLPNGCWGILIADVCGHGTPAAMLMGIAHSLVKTYTGPASPPGLLLSYLNGHLCRHYTRGGGSFVTAMYGIYDPEAATLTFANAGHNSARLIRSSDGSHRALGGRRQFPLGISEDANYPEYTIPLIPGDQLLFYTDGITDAVDPRGEPYGTDRLDEALAHGPIGADAMIAAVLDSMAEFTRGCPARDDRTLVALKFASTPDEAPR